MLPWCQVLFAFLGTKTFGSKFLALSFPYMPNFLWFNVFLCPFNGFSLPKDFHL